jgi:hypothetical protein
MIAPFCLRNDDWLQLVSFDFRRPSEIAQLAWEGLVTLVPHTLDLEYICSNVLGKCATAWVGTPSCFPSGEAERLVLPTMALHTRGFG